ncbi:MAG: glutathione S-transferase family protein [Gammaproteobacteria bacterium]|nr:glutathione S-transferase family protein [Gammaproteobacteria bacterium]
MNELFAFGRTSGSEASDVSYGLGGDMKKTQYVLQLLGFPGHADTLKCLITAVEMGMETDSAVLDVMEGQDESSEYLEISPYGMVPALKEADYYVAGESGIMSYIEARGLGKRLPPKNAALLAEQNYWSDIACSEVGPNIKTLVQERILAPMHDSVYMMNTDAIETARNALIAPLDALDKQLAKNTFIIGNYSFADIHWTAYVHLLYESGDGDLVDNRPNLKAWFDRIRTHKSFSGQNVVAYDILPKLGDIKKKQLNSVVIDDF